MIVNSNDVFKLYDPPYCYQVIDEEENFSLPNHQYTVMLWEKSGTSDSYQLRKSVINIMAASKMDAIRIFNEKYKKA